MDPLSLLGQYSDEDEEQEEEEKALANGSIGGVPAVAVVGQVDEQVLMQTLNVFLTVGCDYMALVIVVGVD